MLTYFLKKTHEIKPSYKAYQLPKNGCESYSKHQPVIVVQNGEAKEVLQDIARYEATQDSIALLKILAMSSKSKQQGKSKSIKTAFSDIRKSIAESE